MITLEDSATTAAANTWHTGLTPTLTVTLTAAPAENEFILAYGRQNSSANVTLPAGFTSIASQAQSGNSYFVAYKIAGASEGSSYGFVTDTSNASNDGFVSIAVYSALDTSAVFDVTFDSSHLETYGSSTSHTPPSIGTRATDTAVLSIIFTSVVTGGPTTYTPPTGYTLDESGGTSNGPAGAIASKIEAAPGNKTPGDWSLSVTSVATLVTLALRDAAATYIEIGDVTWEPPSGYTYKTYEGDVIPEQSLLFKGRGTHTGTTGATLTDSTKSLSANEWENYEVYNFSDNSTGVIGSHIAGDGPLTLITALSGGNNNNFENGDKYDVRVKMTTGDQIGYKTAQTSSSNIFSYEYYLIDVNDGGVSGDHTASVSASGLPANKTGTVSLTTNGVASFTITGDAGGASSMGAILGHNVLGDAILGDIITTSGGDTTAPTLTSPTGSATGATTASGSVSTDENNETLYWICDQSITAPSVAQIQAGQDSGGASADASGNQSVIATGVQNITVTGLAAETTYYLHYQQDDSVPNSSAVVTSSSFTTSAQPTETWVQQQLIRRRGKKKRPGRTILVKSS